jgi:hypothetical protein
LKRIFILQGVVTALYLLISAADGIITTITKNPQGYFVVPTSYINLSQIIHLFNTTLTLPAVSSVYTISVFEILILTEILYAYRRSKGANRPDGSAEEAPQHAQVWTLGKFPLARFLSTKPVD